MDGETNCLSFPTCTFDIARFYMDGIPYLPHFENFGYYSLADAISSMLCVINI